MEYIEVCKLLNTRDICRTGAQVFTHNVQWCGSTGFDPVCVRYLKKQAKNYFCAPFAYLMLQLLSLPHVFDTVMCIGAADYLLDHQFDLRLSCFEMIQRLNDHMMKVLLPKDYAFFEAALRHRYCQPPPTITPTNPRYTYLVAVLTQLDVPWGVIDIHGDGTRFYIHSLHTFPRLGYACAWSQNMKEALVHWCIAGWLLEHGHLRTLRAYRAASKLTRRATSSFTSFALRCPRVLDEDNEPVFVSALDGTYKSWLLKGFARYF